MENSILTSTKKVLGLDASYTPFDHDIIIHINSTFSIINQLGVGPDDGFMIEDESAMWDDFGAPLKQLNLVRSYMYLKVKMLFDPASSRFMIGAIENQIQELEHRLSESRESLIPVPPAPVEVTIPWWQWFDI